MSTGTKLRPGTRLKEWLLRRHSKGWLYVHPAPLDWLGMGQGRSILITCNFHSSGYETASQICYPLDYSEGVQMTTPASSGTMTN